jgi:hypothetical protein
VNQLVVSPRSTFRLLVSPTKIRKQIYSGHPKIRMLFASSASGKDFGIVGGNLAVRNDVAKSRS